MGKLVETDAVEGRVIARGEGEDIVVVQRVAPLIGDVCTHAHRIRRVWFLKPAQRDSRFVSRVVAVDAGRGQYGRDADIL